MLYIYYLSYFIVPKKLNTQNYVRSSYLSKKKMQPMK